MVEILIQCTYGISKQIVEYWRGKCYGKTNLGSLCHLWEHIYLEQEEEQHLAKVCTWGYEAV